MEEIDLSLPSKFMDACVAKDKDKSLEISKIDSQATQCFIRARTANIK